MDLYKLVDLGIVPGFVKQVLKKNKIEYAGNGESGEYIHVSDAAKLIILDNKYSNSAVIITGHQTIKQKIYSPLFLRYLGKRII